MFRGEFSTLRAKYKTDPETGKQEQVDSWEVTDTVRTASKLVMAGILRAKADELDPPKPESGRY